MSMVSYPSPEDLLSQMDVYSCPFVIVFVVHTVFSKKEENFDETYEMSKHFLIFYELKLRGTRWCQNAFYSYLGVCPLLRSKICRSSDLNLRFGF